MKLLLPDNPRILGQGITGREGRLAATAMVNYGTKIVAGVTPGKGGQTLDGIPIFNTVAEALAMVGPVDASVQFVPPLLTYAACGEALEAGIHFILIGAERVATKDIAMILSLAEHYKAVIVGPSSVGLINPRQKLKLGVIGGRHPETIYQGGDIAVISKSGGMTAEISFLLKRFNRGVSWAIGIGGDRLIGSDFADWLMAIETDPMTRASIIFGELGGTYEERVADLVRGGRITKPVIALVVGDFATHLPSDVQFGHAGALIENGQGEPATKRKVLKTAGVLVANQFDDLIRLIEQAAPR